MSRAGPDWRDKAGMLAERFPREAFHPKVDAWLRRHPDPEPWGLACSGGADSLCLLLLLYGHFPERRSRMSVLHFNHRLRGQDSDGDADRVDSVAAALGLDCRAARWTQAPPAGNATEEAARAARFGFFYRALKETGGRVLFFGHQRDDVAETLLIRLSRGSGTAGLAAPRPVHTFAGGRVHLRPLLALGAEEIRSAMRELGISWSEDASNQEPSYYRNRIRRTVIPEWQKAAPSDVAAGAAAARELLEEDDEALEECVDQLLPETAPDRPFPARILRAEPAAIRRRALNRWLTANGLRKHLNEKAFQRLLEAVCGSAPFRCSAGPEFLEYDGDSLCRRSAGAARPAWTGEVGCPLDVELHLPGESMLRIVLEELDAETKAAILGGMPDPSVEAFLDAGAVESSLLRVRPWREGDRYRPLGAPGSRKLQDAFTDRGISSGERRKLPVVCLVTGTIAWCPGLIPDERVRIKESTKHVVRLTYASGKAT